MGALLAALLLWGSMWPGVATDEVGTDRSALPALLGSEADPEFPRVTGPRTFSFPADHGPHPEYRNEWWYLTGNLDSERGRRFGFELTIFRFALTPEIPVSASRWRANQVYVAHFAITDTDREDFYVAERFSRGALGLAGAQAEPFRVWIDDWEIAAANIRGNAENWRVRATDDDIAIDLTLVAMKAPVLNGIDGVSQKSDEPGNASYYYSITRWQTDGIMRVGDEQFAVSGLSWLDREWSSSALDADQQGWDWFALQLGDGSELMFYNIRKTDGEQDRNSAGTWIAADGTAQYLSRDEIAIAVENTWTSPAGGDYPSAWSIRVPGLGLTLYITPIIDNQELFTTVRYWEGAVDITGQRNGATVNGRGYVELTGYAN